MCCLPAAAVHVSVHPELPDPQLLPVDRVVRRQLVEVVGGTLGTLGPAAPLAWSTVLEPLEDVELTVEVAGGHVRVRTRATRRETRTRADLRIKLCLYYSYVS